MNDFWMVNDIFQDLDAVKHHLSQIFVCRPCLELSLAAGTENFINLHEHLTIRAEFLTLLIS